MKPADKSQYSDNPQIPKADIEVNIESVVDEKGAVVEMSTTTVFRGWKK